MRNELNVVGSLLVGAALFFSSGCSTMEKRAETSEMDNDIDARYRAILPRMGEYGPGGREVLDTAYKVLREGKAEGKWPVVGLEDLWAESIKEGRSLFSKPDRLWGKTTAKETRDMIGQTTIGPWQITVTNVKTIYGLPYGISPEWSNEKVYAYCRDHPEIQAKMIADYIQEAYTKYGRRGPYGIQRYFWLEAYVKGWIGQGQWDKSVLPQAPDGDWTQLTDEMKADTGFYAKQLFLGWKHQPGLLYWLWVTGDKQAIVNALRTWRDQRKMVWDENLEDAVPTPEPGGFAIHPEDLKYAKRYPEFYADVLPLVEKVLKEKH